MGEWFAAELARVLKSIERRLRPLVASASEGSATSILKAAHAQRTRSAIVRVLADSGYAELAQTAYGSRLDDIVAGVLHTRTLADAAIRESGAFDQRIAAIKILHETDLLDEGEEVARALWQAVIRGVFAARDVDAILADLADVLDASEPQIRTLYDTSVSIFGRQVEALQAGDDQDAAFLYAGPADEKTRAFCLERVGRVYLRSEIDQWDNGQIDNPFLTCGGWNCRHVLMEVSKFSELQSYVGTDKRVPQVASQLPQRKAA